MTAAVAYFDSRHEQMAAGNEAEGLRALCYDQQAAYVERLVQPGSVVLDVGCGPKLPYHLPYAHLIGLDPSASSLAANTDVDERLVGTAEAIPLPARSVDVVVAFYSLHHMTGQTVAETERIRAQALSEMLRVLVTGGRLFVFEMTPWPIAGALQATLWPLAKAVLGDRLDAYFGIEGAPPARTFTCSPWATFPPAFSLPWLRVPRFLYPFDAVLYRWMKE